MSIYTGIECDKCKAKSEWKDAIAKKYVVSWAREKGWSIGKKILCPVCK